MRRGPAGGGLGIAARFAIAIGGVVAGLMILFALLILGSVGPVIERQVDQAGIVASRSLAAGGADAWQPPKDAAERKAFINRGRLQLKRLIESSKDRILNAWITGTDLEPLVNYFKIDSFRPTVSDRTFGLTTVSEGIYKSGALRALVRLYKTPIVNAHNVLIGHANVVQQISMLEDELSGLSTKIILFAVLMIGVTFGFAWMVAGKVASPLSALVQAVSRINRGNLHYRSTIRSRDEVGQLAKAIEAMTEGLREAEEAGERLSEHEEEVRSLSELSMAFQPERLPTVEGFEVDSVHQSGSRGVAGFYDAVPLSDGRLALVVATTSGKGALGAQLAGMTRSYLHACLDRGAEAGEALRATNRNLALGMRKGMHVTAQVAVLDPSASRATVHIAGHRAPFYACRGGDISVVHGEGLALGLDKGPVFDKRLEEVVVEMPPGTRIVLTTTGTYELENDSGERFTVENFQELVRKHAPKNTGAFLNLVLGSLDVFLGECEREYDATLVTAKRMV